MGVIGLHERAREPIGNGPRDLITGVLEVRRSDLNRHGIRQDPFMGVQDDDVPIVPGVELRHLSLELGLSVREGMSCEIPDPAHDEMFEHLGDALGFLERLGFNGRHIPPDGDTGHDGHQDGGDAKSGPQQRQRLHP
jgi:hypothetical protein